jgi:hypothetical protein
VTHLTDKQWANLIDFYDKNHSMIECAKIWKVTHATISLKFKRMGKKARPRFVPCRPSKQDNLPDYHYMKNGDPSQLTVEEDPAPQDVQEVRPSRKRKIVSL